MEVEKIDRKKYEMLLFKSAKKLRSESLKMWGSDFKLLIDSLIYDISTIKNIDLVKKLEVFWVFEFELMLWGLHLKNVLYVGSQTKIRSVKFWEVFLKNELFPHNKRRKKYKEKKDKEKLL